MKKLNTVLICIVLLYSCISQVNVLKPQGESVTLTLTNLSEYYVELLTISDSTISVLHNNKICRLPLNKIKQLYIHDYRINPANKLSAAVIPVLIEGVVLWAAIQVDQPAWAIISGLTIAGTIYSFVSGNPKTTFSTPYTKEDIENLKLYCRYPQNLNNVKWKELLKHFNQDDFQSLSN